jgi:hypothetical protein
MIRKSILAASALAAFALPQVASAAVTVTSSTPYGFGAIAGDTTGKVVTFDRGSATYQIGGNAKVASGNLSNVYAAPATSVTTEDTTNYLAAFPTMGEVGLGAGSLFGFGLAKAVTFYWGSIDSFNTLDFYSGDTLLGSVFGQQASAWPNGDQDSGVTNRTVSISSDKAFDKLVFRTGQNAFEADSFKFTAAVPEPATWGMMILGFGAIGMAMRSSRRRQGAAVAA